MPNSGWVKLYRKITENGFYHRSAYVHLWVHLLLEANHEIKHLFWNGEDITIEPGQLVTGRTQLSEDTGIPSSTIEDILNSLEKQQQIRQQKTTKFRIISIVKWSEYQGSDNKSDNKATTKQQQSNTNKNEKKLKNEKNINIPPAIEDVEAYCLERKNGVNPKTWWDAYAAKGWMIGKSKMVDWQAAVRTWEKPKSTKTKEEKFLEEFNAPAR